MALPTDFDSFVSGFNLTNANYSAGSGVGGGTFANMVSGQDGWVRGSTGPTFSNIGGTSQIEAASFDGTVNSAIVGRWVIGQECTVIITAQQPSVATLSMLWGPTETASNRWYGSVSAAAKVTNGYNGWAENCASVQSVTANTAFVAAYGYSPEAKRAWVQLNKNTAVSDATTTRNIIWSSWYEVAIGQSRTTYFITNGKIGRVLIFSRCLFERDDTNLQALITTECANIGI